MNESIAVDGNADMQFFVCEVHEYKIAFMHLAARDRHAGAQLLVRGSRHRNTRASRRVRDQSAAIEPAGRGAAVAIRLAEHGQGIVDHEFP